MLMGLCILFPITATTQTLIHSTGKLVLSITPLPTYQQGGETRLAWMDVGIVEENGHVEPLDQGIGVHMWARIQTPAWKVRGTL